MRLTTRQTGIISYAGLDERALWEAAKYAFALSDDPPPERFRDFLPLFPAELIVNMRYVGEGRFALTAAEYHQKLSEEMPALYAGDNALRCFDKDGRFRAGAVVTVDPAWTAQFPQYRPFAGEKLMLHRIGGGHQAVAVPESLFPRGGGILAGVEEEMHISVRCRHFTHWLSQRLDAGARYDPAVLEAAYLAETGLESVCVTQSDLCRVMQEVSVIRQLHGEGAGALSAQESRRAGSVPQYVPYRYACDCFEEAPITRQTARLMQLHFSGDRVPSDFWLPYQEASLFIHKRRGTLDVRALCEAFQIAPACDADTRGGCYPDHARVVVVRDRSLRLLTADCLNNPAYGSGTGPQGLVNKRVYLPRSRELLKQKRLNEEPCSVTCIRTRVEEDEYLRMRAQAERQEYKGRLIDAMYRRETALRQLPPGTRAYERAREVLDEKVNRLLALVQPLPEARPLYGYDADIDHLRRMALNREGVEALPPDEQRERSIESGYAMRASLRRFALSELYDKPAERPPKSAERPRSEQAANGMWFEQMRMFEEVP